MMGLRLDEGVSLSAVAARHGDAGMFIDPDALAGLVAAGMLAQDGDRVRVTPPGRLFSTASCPSFLPWMADRETISCRVPAAGRGKHRPRFGEARKRAGYRRQEAGGRRR